MDNKNFTAINFALGCINFPADTEIEKTPHLLLVDDEPRMLDSLGQLLRNRGYKLSEASSGSDAVALLSQNYFDIVLLDIQLPDMSGHEVMDFINANSMDVTVIISSGDTRIESAIGALQRGAYGYLRKPYQHEELYRLLDNATHKRLLEARNRHIAWRLEYSEKLYRNLIDSSPDIIYTLDKHGRFTFVNHRAQQLLGFSASELVGQHYSILVPDEDLTKAHFVFNERRADERASRNVELRLRSNNIDDDDRTFDQTLMTISFDSTGMYLPDQQIGQQEYFGTYVVARDITDRKRAEELISYQAYHDILTGLPNRILLKEQVSLAIIQARRSNAKLAVMLINLDRFKLINDTFGHVKGDELLQQVAARLKEMLRNGAMLARHGGDEFTLILPCVKGRPETAEFAQEILECLQAPFMIDGFEANVSASIGIAIYPEDGDSINELFRHADIAMHLVKSSSKDGFGFYDRSMRDVSHLKIAKEKKLRKAVDKQELEMYYQPQIDIATGRIVGAEALMRWNHPDRGLLAAADFLPFAEEIGLMTLLSDFMLKAVCTDMIACRDAGCDPIRLAINISPQYLDHRDFYKKLQNALVEHDIPPSRLELEITENICIRNPQHANEQLNKLSELGVGVAIDDFGTGYSSLAYLHRFPVHTIKVDKMFVKEILSEDGHFPVVLAIISIAKGLGLNLIAEGVETQAQSRYLELAGCNTMQGYLFHKPLPRTRLIELLQEQARKDAP